MNKRIIFFFAVLIAFLSLNTERKAEAQTPKGEYDGWIVSFDSARSPESLGLDNFGKVTKYAKGKNFPYSFAVVRPQSGKRPVSDLSRMQGVRRVEPNYVVRLNWEPNDPKYVNGEQWYLGPTATNMAVAWPTGTSETIGIIDTGCASHIDLPTIPQSDRFETLGGVIVGGGANDSYGHGTWSQGIIEALSNNGVGIAGIIINPSRFVCIKAFNDSGGGSWADLILATQLAKDQGVKLLNAPWGESWDSQLFSDSVSYFLGSGDNYLIASCGNDGNSSCNYPANYYNSMEGVIAVGGLTQSMMLYGNAGSMFVEPATSICSTIPGNAYACHDGVSGAVPIALGIASATHNTFPLPRGAFLQHLKNKAVDLGAPGFDSSFGWGILTGQTIVASSAEKKLYFFPMIVR